MKLENVLIKRVGEVRWGTSETTGKAWASKNVLIAFEDETGESYINAGVDEDVWGALGYQEGDIVCLGLRCRTKRFLNGFVANDIRIVQS